MGVISLRGDTLRLLAKYGIRPKKRLGQNFLVSERARDAIIRALAPTNTDVVLEIGAGLGTLTVALAPLVSKVIAVEVDRKLVEALRDRVRKFGNVEIMWQDFLDMEMPRVTKVLSNTPYSVASRILVKLAKEGGFRRGVLVLQRELALRLLAKPGTESYGRLSVIMQLSFEIEHAGYIPRTAFYPQPKVDSLIVILKPKGRCGVKELEKVERLTAILFSQRRRKLGKVLKVKLPKLYEVLKDDRSPLLEKRVYELTPQEILLLSRIYA